MDTKKLRQKILDLAIRGKLVPQDPNDEPASVLLERIRAEKERLIKEGKIKRSKKNTSDTPHYENMPFEIPNGWEWCKLDDLAFYKKGPFGSSLTKSMFVPESPSVYKVYEQKNAINKDCSLGHYFINAEKYEELKGFAVSPHDIIVSCAGTIGETYVLPDNIRAGIINQALMIIRLYDTCITDFYLLYFDFILKNEAAKESKGTAIKNIPPFDILKNFLIPIPPISEQIRIIEEVNKWLNVVQQIDDSGEDISNLIYKTKSKILDLAIHGKLVPQNPNDEPAIDLLKRVNAKITPCDNAHKRNHIPESWCWTTLSSVCELITGSTPSKNHLEFYGGDFPFYKPSNLDAGRHVTIPSEYLTNEGKAVSRIIPKWSTAICCIGSIGKCGFIEKEGTTNQQINTAVPSNCLYPLYLYYFCNTEFFIDELQSDSSAITIAIVNKSKLGKMDIPIPPYQEQQRIVAKIEELFIVLDEIQKTIEA